MRFRTTILAGVMVIDPELIKDERGFFARTFCRHEFEQQGLNPHLEQCNISFNKKKGTLRGMHYQASPHEEEKLVRCTRGSILDVVIDLRPDSKTFKQWLAFELSQRNHQMLYIPKGFAHGFQTLEDNTEVFYQMSSPFAAQAALGIRWDDPAFNIVWPEAQRTMSLKDQTYPDFRR